MRGLAIKGPVRYPYGAVPLVSVLSPTSTGTHSFGSLSLIKTSLYALMLTAAEILALGLRFEV